MNNVTANKFTGTDLIGQQLNVSGVSTFSDDILIGTGATVGFGTTAYFKDHAGIFLGDEEDLRIFHDGTESFIHDNGTGGLVLLTGSSPIELRPQMTDPSEKMLLATPNDAVELYYNGDKKFETTNEVLVSGGTTTGSMSVSGVSTFSNDILIGTGATVGFGSTAYFKDDAGAFFGDDDDLRIYHDSINVIIHDKGTGNLVLQSDNKIEMITFNPPLGGGAEKMFEAVKNGAVTLYFDGNKRIETTTTGVSVSGIGSFDSIGIQTSAPSTDLQIRKASGEATLEVISDTAQVHQSASETVSVPEPVVHQFSLDLTVDLVFIAQINHLISSIVTPVTLTIS